MPETETKDFTKTITIYLTPDPLNRWHTMRIDTSLIEEFKAIFKEAGKVRECNVVFEVID